MVHTPAHSGLGEALTYSSDRVLAPGTLVRVPLGSRELLGVVWEPPDQDTSAELTLRAVSHTQTCHRTFERCHH